MLRSAIHIYRKAYTGLSPATWWLCLVMLINRSGTMVLPFMTLYLTQKLGFSIPQAGVVVALFGAGAVCGGLIGGKLTDKFGFYYVQLFTLIGGGIMFMVLGQMIHYPSICLFTFLLSLVNESFRPANAAAIAQYSSPENRTRSYSLNRLSINLGWAFGGAIGGFIAATNYHLLFWIDGFTNVFAATLLWILLKPSKTPKAEKHIPSATLPQSAYRDKPYLIFIVLTILFAYCFFQIFTTLPVFLKTSLGLTERFIGFTMALNGLIIAFFEMVIIHNLEGRKPGLYFIPIGVALCGLGFVLLNLLPGAQLVTLTFILLITIGEIVAMPFMNSYWISRTNPANRGQYAGLYTIAWSLAQVLAPATGSLLANGWGFSTLWWFVAAVCFVAAAGFQYMYRKQL